MEKQIIDALITLFGAVDQRQWADVRRGMTDQLWLDYASLSGSPGATLSAQTVISGWQSVLPGFDRTHHQLSDFSVSPEGESATLRFTGKADHFLNEAVWTVVGHYDATVIRQHDRWLLSRLTFHLTEQSGDQSLPAQATQIVNQLTNNTMNNAWKAGPNPVQFTSEGETLVGTLYLPDDYQTDQKLPGVIVTGSWTTVKEQMAGTYAQEAAQLGYAALAFDFRYFGESGGFPRQYERPEAKVKDIRHAMDFMQSLPIIEPERVGGLGVCASAGYMVTAAAQDDRFKSLSLVAPWIHDAEIVRQIYGGEEGVAKNIERSKAAQKLYDEKKLNDYVPVASITDENAIMHMPMAVDDPHWDYYVNEQRGAIKEWRNQLQLMSWEPWLTFDGQVAAREVTAPVLMVNSENMAVPQGAKKFHTNLTSPKKEVWLDGYYQLDYYDQEKPIAEAMGAVQQHFSETL